AKGDFRGIKLSNETHRSSTDPEALLARKSKAHPAQLSYRGHVLVDNRHDLIVDCRVTQATGTGERDAAKEMAEGLAGAHQKTLGADKNDDTKGFVAEMRRLGVTPHVAQNTTRHVGYAKSINARRGIEKVFGWIKAFGGLRQFKLRGTEKVSAVFGLHVIAYNLIRLGNLLRPTMAAA
ncbi:transposase, partial [Microcystis elabens FACHB-917]|nr:transposase [Microcystis elabens FACHB-917]